MDIGGVDDGAGIGGVDDGAGAGVVDDCASVEDDSDNDGVGIGYCRCFSRMLVGSKLILEVSENIIFMEILRPTNSGVAWGLTTSAALLLA